jgi:hypothetical protein
LATNMNASHASEDGNLQLYARRVAQAVARSKRGTLSVKQAATATGLKRPGLGIVTILRLVALGRLRIGA